jgi:hypothetical protein
MASKRLEAKQRSEIITCHESVQEFRQLLRFDCQCQRGMSFTHFSGNVVDFVFKFRLALVLLQACRVSPQFAVEAERGHLTILHKRRRMLVCMTSRITRPSICLLGHRSLSQTFLPFKARLLRFLRSSLNSLSNLSLSIVTVRSLVARFDFR